MVEETEKIKEYKTYRMRWLLLFIECYTNFVRNYIAKSFGTVNGVVAKYFKVSPSEVDTLGLADNLTAPIICILLAFLGTRLGLRVLMLTKTFCVFVSAALCSIGFLSRDFFWIVLTGRIIMGLPEALLYVLSIVLAANWFPKTELAISFSISTICLQLGGGAAALVLPFLESHDRRQFNTVMPNHSNTVNHTAVSTLDQLIFMSYYGSAALLMFVALVLSIIFSKDHPPSPPSASQQNITKETLDTQSTYESVKNNWKELKELLAIPQFLLLCLFGLFRTATHYNVVLLASFMLASMPELDERTPGILLLLMLIIGGIVGSPIAGIILDRFKVYKSLTIASGLGMVLGVFIAYLGHLLKNLYLMFVGYILQYIFICINVVSTAEFLTETTYPRNKFIASLLFYATTNFSIFGLTAFVRWVQVISDETWAVFSTIPILLLGLIILSLVKPEYKRTAVDAKNRTETQKYKRKAKKEESSYLLLEHR